MKQDRILVSSGVISRRGKYLIQKRKKNQIYPDFWEFSGGRVQPGERTIDTLFRELNEELGITPKKSSEIATIDHDFNDGTSIRISYFDVSEFTGKPYHKECQQIRWVDLSQIGTFSLLDPDRKLLDILFATKQTSTWNQIWEKDVYAKSSTRKKRARKKVTVLLREGFQLQEDDFVLEIGCGSGYVLKEIISHFPNYKRIAGCDISTVAIHEARQTLDNNKTKVNLYSSDAQKLPFGDASVEKIIMFGVLEHILNDVSALTEVERVLKKDGQAYFTTSNKYSLVYGMKLITKVLQNAIFVVK